jgi:hypothetical protein
VLRAKQRRPLRPGAVSPDYVPNPKRRLPHQLARVGVQSSDMEVSGARSIVEAIPGQTNAATVARQLVARGFRGCWILALGTNDTADVHVGSNVNQRERIARMMSIIGRRPALWLDAISLRQSGPYSEQMMQRWNRALIAACRRYPTMRVYDWAARAKRGWFDRRRHPLHLARLRQTKSHDRPHAGQGVPARPAARRAASSAEGAARHPPAASPLVATRREAGQHRLRGALIRQVLGASELPGADRELLVVDRGTSIGARRPCARRGRSASAVSGGDGGALRIVLALRAAGAPAPPRSARP